MAVSEGCHSQYHWPMKPMLKQRTGTVCYRSQHLLQLKQIHPIPNSGLKISATWLLQTPSQVPGSCLHVGKLPEPLFVGTGGLHSSRKQGIDLVPDSHSRVEPWTEEAAQDLLVAWLRETVTIRLSKCSEHRYC